MPRTVPGRRVVVAAEAVQEAAEKAESKYEQDLDAQPATRVRPSQRRLSYKERLLRRLEMADMALVKYEERLEDGKEMTPEEERLFLAHQDSIRKLEATLAQLEAKDKGDESKSDAQYVIDLLDAGWSLENACRAFKHNPNILSEVEKAIEERDNE